MPSYHGGSLRCEACRTRKGGLVDDLMPPNSPKRKLAVVLNDEITVANNRPKDPDNATKRYQSMHILNGAHPERSRDLLCVQALFQRQDRPITYQSRFMHIQVMHIQVR